MNAFQIGAHPFKGGFIAFYRRVHKSTNEVLKDDKGAEIVFPSRAEAEAAAGRALTKYLNGSECFTGVIPSIRTVRKTAAEKVFKQGASA